MLLEGDRKGPLRRCSFLEKLFLNSCTGHLCPNSVPFYRQIVNGPWGFLHAVRQTVRLEAGRFNNRTPPELWCTMPWAGDFGMTKGPVVAPHDLAQAQL